MLANSTAMFHVYVIFSETHPERYYIGFSSRPAERLNEHNAGKNPFDCWFCPVEFRRDFQLPCGRTRPQVRTLSEKRFWPSFSSSTRS